MGAPRKHKLLLNRHESDIRGSGLKSYNLQEGRFGYAGVPNHPEVALQVSFKASMPAREYPIKIAFHATATLELAYTKGHHDPATVEREVRTITKAVDGGWVEPQHGWWRWQPIRGAPGRKMMAAAPFTHGAFPVTWMERRKR